LGNGHSPTDRARRRLAAARDRYQGSWVQEIATQLKVLDVAKWTTVFGAELLWSVVPLLILLSSLANERIDDELSRHIGVTGEGVHIIRSLLRNSPTHPLVPILTGLIFAFVGSIALVGSLQVLYERTFDQQPRGWRDILPWRVLVRPALVTATLWLALALFSSISLSATIVSDSRLYGTIGVVFTLLTWFILIATVLVLGATLGAVWQNRKGQGLRAADSVARPSKVG
jgi:Virulence factor BrkB